VGKYAIPRATGSAEWLAALKRHMVVIGRQAAGEHVWRKEQASEVSEAAANAFSSKEIDGKRSWLCCELNKNGWRMTWYTSKMNGL
jgi:hypothetical protein